MTTMPITTKTALMKIRRIATRKQMKILKRNPDSFQPYLTNNR